MVVVQYGGFEASNNNWPYTTENIDQYSLPMSTADTVPAYALALFPIGLWAAFVLVEIFCNSSATAHQKFRFALLIGMTLFEVFIVTSTLTGIAKVVVSEPRPDFKVRCLGSDPTVPPTYDTHGNVICTGAAALILDGRSSFPSGHASSSMSSGMFGTLYLLWLAYFRKIDLPWRSHKGCQTLFTYQTVHTLFCVALVPFFIALAIACTRVRDHRHSPADITGGALLGACVAALYFFPRILLASPETECMDDECVCNAREWLPLKTPRPSAISTATTTSTTTATPVTSTSALTAIQIL
jgi:membrane-associated phospholipid phosphatase